MKSSGKRLAKTPHLFAKLVVIYCVAFSSGASLWALRILSRTGHDTAPVLGIILAFFGGELLLLCLKTIFSKRKEDSDGVHL